MKSLKSKTPPPLLQISNLFLTLPLVMQISSSALTYCNFFLTTFHLHWDMIDWSRPSSGTRVSNWRFLLFFIFLKDSSCLYYLGVCSVVLDVTIVFREIESWSVTGFSIGGELSIDRALDDGLNVPNYL